MSNIVSPFTNTLSKSEVRTRIKQIVRAKVGPIVDSYTNFGQVRTALNNGTPVDYRINSWEAISSFNQKLNTYHNDTARIALSSIFYGENQVAFDFTTADREFQDLVGTPVTAAGQNVGMVRDALTPLNFGTELVVNGDFSVGTGWTFGSGWTISGGVASKVSGLATNLRQTATVSITAGRVYKLTFDATVSAGTLTPTVMNAASQVILSSTAITASGSITQFITAPSGAARIAFLNDAAFVGSIDNVSLQEVNGYVATNSSVSTRGRWASLPITGRRNLLLWSEDPTKSPWTTVFAAVTSAPSVLGYPLYTVTTTSDVTSGNFFGRVQQSLVLPTGLHTWTNIQAANADGNIVMVVTATSPAGVGGSAGSKTVVYNTITQQFTSQGLGTGGVYRVENLGSGLWKITLTFNVTGTGTIFFQRAVEQTATAVTSVGKTIVVGPMQVEVGSAATVYQRVDSSDYVTEVGVNNAGMWTLDLVDDALSFNLSSAVDGELFLIGRNGSWRESRSSTLGSTITVGGTGAGTISTRGILRATGPIVSMGFKPGVISDEEWDLIKKRYQDFGAKGELIPGTNMILNGTFDNNITSWTQPQTSRGTVSWANGSIRITDAAAGVGNFVQQSITTEIGKAYLVRAEIIEAVNTGGLVFAGVTQGVPSLGSTVATLNATGIVSFVIVPTTTTTLITLFSSASTVAGATVRFDNVSVRPLTPEW